jgi:hypothetical protein
VLARTTSHSLNFWSWRTRSLFPIVSSVMTGFSFAPASVRRSAAYPDVPAAHDASGNEAWNSGKRTTLGLAVIQSSLVMHTQCVDQDYHTSIAARSCTNSDDRTYGHVRTLCGSPEDEGPVMLQVVARHHQR